MKNGNSIKLVVDYRTPSLNVTKRQHWTKQFTEKKRAMRALASALQATASNPSIRTTSPEVSRICSTAYDTLVSYLATSHGELSWRLDKLRSGDFPTNGQK